MAVNLFVCQMKQTNKEVHIVGIDTLFDICMNFIVKHINLVDSFVGFPELIGEKIFRKFISVTSEVSPHNVLKKFVEAYGNLVLERLNLFKNVLMLNEYFDSIVVISSSVTELCLCNCYLGKNHDIYSHIANFQCLKKLCLRKNSMDDTSIRMLTLRMRMFEIGGKEVEYLDLADNNCTDVCIPRLAVFPKLNFLNLTGSQISNKGITILKEKYNFKQIFECKAHRDITTEGWATILFEKWDAAHKTKVQQMARIFKLRRLLLPELEEDDNKASSSIPLVFQKSTVPDYGLPPTKKKKL